MEFIINQVKIVHEGGTIIAYVRYTLMSDHGQPLGTKQSKIELTRDEQIAYSAMLQGRWQAIIKQEINP